MNSDTGAPSTPTGGLASVSGAATARVDRWNVRRTAATLIANGGEWGTQCEANPRSSVRRSVYYRGPRYDWSDDAPPLTPLEDSVVYELHVRAF